MMFKNIRKSISNRNEKDKPEKRKSAIDGEESSGSHSYESGEKERVIPESERSQMIETCESFISFMKDHDFDKLSTLSEEKKAEVIINQGDTIMSMKDFIESNHHVAASFPDLAFEYRKIEVIEGRKVVVSGFRGSGTHTGRPYGFAPFPEVPTSGIAVKNDPETFVFELNEKCEVRKLRIEATGEMSGPPGFYKQIGGFPF